MAARLEQDAKRRAEKKPVPVVETALPRSVQEIDEEFRVFIQMTFAAIFKQELLAMEFVQAGNELPHPPSPAEAWDKAVESLGRSAGILVDLAESTGEAIARIAVRGDRIDRVQKETRAFLNALVALEADA